MSTQILMNIFHKIFHIFKRLDLCLPLITVQLYFYAAKSYEKSIEFSAIPHSLADAGSLAPPREQHNDQIEIKCQKGHISISCVNETDRKEADSSENQSNTSVSPEITSVEVASDDDDLCKVLELEADKLNVRHHHMLLG
ncbi:hypothetical protein QAD02_015919 [Eretmocerus hayati]|uniref:Uncharacterized protein n=1 Tax=Eretmocerus hayati TaxID=131215 RepID=A0ACC2P9M6_9HYME|nr:hypothetical protein QAD02_015919 [Eretmocerus hayati]